MIRYQKSIKPVRSLNVQDDLTKKTLWKFQKMKVFLLWSCLPVGYNYRIFISFPLQSSKIALLSKQKCHTAECGVECVQAVGSSLFFVFELRLGALIPRSVCLSVCLSFCPPKITKKITKLNKTLQNVTNINKFTPNNMKMYQKF